MPRLGINEAYKKNLPIILIEDVFFLSEENYAKHIKSINTLINYLKHRKMIIPDTNMCIAEFRLGKETRCNEDYLIPIDDFQYCEPKFENMGFHNEIQNNASSIISSMLSRKRLFTSIVGYFLPYYFVFVNDFSHLLAFLESYDVLLNNPWYRKALSNNHLIVVYNKTENDSNSTGGFECDLTNSLSRIFDSDGTPSCFLLQFGYEELDDNLLDKILNINPYFGNRELFDVIAGLHNRDAELTELVPFEPYNDDFESDLW